ncbi:MAG TPA: hypothetical protein VKF79_02225, partial [Candidatus Acidoferrum sp.]|nr:hypothetical protein [Candidatus Acidoferrum sp.]
RAAFTAELQSAILHVVQKHSAPFVAPPETTEVASGGPAAAGRAYRLVLGCYPLPLAGSKDTESSSRVPETTTNELDGES